VRASNERHTGYLRRRKMKKHGAASPAAKVTSLVGLKKSHYPTRDDGVSIELHATRSALNKTRDVGDDVKIFPLPRIVLVVLAIIDFGIVTWNSRTFDDASLSAIRLLRYKQRYGYQCTACRSNRHSP
jgi:hypothetical protein